MEGVIINIDLKKKGLKIDDDWNLEPLSDIHVGHPNFNEEKFVRVVKRIASHKDRSTLLLGDNTDNIAPGDKRFKMDIKNISGVNVLPTAQFSLLRKLLMPIWKQNQDNTKCWGATIGNHEYNGFHKMTEDEFKMMYCNSVHPPEDSGEVPGMGFNYLGTMAYIKVKFSHGGKHLRDYMVYTAHGGYKGSQSGGELNQQKRFPAAHENFDAYLTGDSHDTKVDKSTLQTGIEKDGKLMLKRRKVWFASCGTFQETYAIGYTNYPETRPYYSRNAETGTITLTFNPYLDKLFAHG